MRHSTLFEAQDMAIPIVNKALPQIMVLRLPRRSAIKKPVNRLPAKAPAWIEAVIPPWRPFEGSWKNLLNWVMVKMPEIEPAIYTVI
jgi:hypothetical protein